ncbi:hypothetical protein K456DRAFT_55395 [Colletotrichum gloeosporioides 23]|nr:hypothetical protein K456DRAFT_55395 [Colletotrichum gloeosporioides 23]
MPSLRPVTLGKLAAGMIASFHPPTGPPGNTACYRQASPNSTPPACSVFAGRTPDFSTSPASYLT